MRNIDTILMFSFGATLTVALSLAAPSGAQAPPHSAPTAADTASCIEHAHQSTNLVDIQITRLCYATPSPTLPVDCFVEASRTLLLTDLQSIALCRCTDSMVPVQCFRRLRDAALLTETELLAACSPTIANNLRLDCTPL